MAQKRDWLLGSIEPLLLHVLSQQPMYGYQIIRELESRSQGYFRFKEGTLYPVLHRLEQSGLVRGQWQTLPSGRQRKYYQITEKGLATLAERRSQLREFLTAMEFVIQPPPA
jgi:DNA-binding PadR family transcriptional regulator